jgi:hypothetical protein
MVTTKWGVSRREVNEMGRCRGLPVAGPAVAAQNSGNNIHWLSGLTDAPVTYFDVIDPTGGRTGNRDSAERYTR